ncbi:MAG: hypothetical protein ACREXJ_09395 [Gammaproteobacteria bacterium]
MKQRNSTSDAGIGIDASDTAQPTPNEATISDARTNVPREAASATEALTAGGNGKDGTLSVLAPDGQPLFQTVRGSVGNGALKHVAARIGGGTVGGLLQLVDREGKQSVHIDGTNGSLSLRSQIAMKGKDNNDQIILSTTSNRSALSIGAPERPGFIKLTTGGNPGPTIELDGERNSLLFLTKGSRTDSVLELNGNAATVRAGGNGKNGTVSVLGTDGQQAIELNGNTATVRAGGNGKNGTVSVLGADGQPLLELLGRSNECVMGLGQKNRPARISLYGANQQEAIRLDAAAGDIMLMNADCAEEFDLAVQDVQPGTVMVLTDDGRLAPSSEPYDDSRHRRGVRCGRIPPGAHP